MLLVTLTVNDTVYSSGSSYMYRWRETPEVSGGGKGGEDEGVGVLHMSLEVDTRDIGYEGGERR